MVTEQNKILQALQISIQMEINGKSCVGYIHNLDFVRGGEHVFASVAIDNPEDPDNSPLRRVTIKENGSVQILPD